MRTQHPSSQIPTSPRANAKGRSCGGRCVKLRASRLRTAPTEVLEGRAEERRSRPLGTLSSSLVLADSTSFGAPCGPKSAAAFTGPGTMQLWYTTFVKVARPCLAGPVRKPMDAASRVRLHATYATPWAKFSQRVSCSNRRSVWPWDFAQVTQYPRATGNCRRRYL